jgi:Tfp pilus assembly protein PilV
MTYHSIKNKRHGKWRSMSGMTLIEVMIYSALLSMLMAGFIGYVWTIHFNDIRLSHDIEDAYDE